MSRTTRARDRLEQPSKKSEGRATRGIRRQVRDPKSEILDLQHAAGNQATSHLLKASSSNEQHEMTNMPPIVESVLKRRGEPLNSKTRELMEPVFHEDFANVRVHADSEAAASARAIGAMAYTGGQHLVFGDGQYQPETEAGNKLLAHELGHTIEQSDAGITASSANPAKAGIMRAPLPGAAGSASLLGSEIPAPSIIRSGDATTATLYFGQNQFLLDSRNLEALDKLGEGLGFVLDPIISVDGYASSEGTAESNLKLSENRRSTVIALLRSRVVGTATFAGSGHGEEAESAKAGPEREQQRGLNRRVTIVVFSRAALRPDEEKEKKPDLTVHGPGAETEKERLQREAEEAIQKAAQSGPPPPRPTLSEQFWKKFDEKVDDVSRKFGIPKKYRGYVRDGAHALAEKGADAVLGQALDLTGLSGPEKEAFKAAIKAAAQTAGQTKVP